MKFKYFNFLVFIQFIWLQTGIDIAKMMDAKGQPNNLKSTMTMVLTNKKGKSQTSIIKSISEGGGKKQIIWFLEPKINYGIALLKIEYDDKPDDMRLWLPAFKRVNRITTKKKSSSFMKSDLSYEDLYNRNLNKYDFILLRQENLNNVICYVLESTPNDQKNSGYSKHITWIDKKMLIPIKEESFDKSGKLYKTKEYTYSRIDTYDILSMIKVIDVQRKHSTHITFDDVVINSSIGNNLFQEMSLKRIPK